MLALKIATISFFSPLLIWFHWLHHKRIRMTWFFVPFGIFNLDKHHKWHHRWANTSNDKTHPKLGESVYKNIIKAIWHELGGVPFQFLFFMVIHIKMSTEISLFCILSGLWLRVFNYCQHYGLEKIGDPRTAWETKHHWISWIYANADAHATHHIAPSASLKEIVHQKGSPKLPFNLFICAIISLCPPLWFKIMDARLNEYLSKRVTKISQ